MYDSDMFLLKEGRFSLIDLNTMPIADYIIYVEKLVEKKENEAKEMEAQKKENEAKIKNLQNKSKNKKFK